MCGLGPGLSGAVFHFFDICETTHRGVSNARRKCFSSSVWHFLSLERIVRVNSGAEGALECFEELKKIDKSHVFDASALFSFLAWIVSDVNSETRLEIAKFMSPVKCRLNLDLSSGTPPFSTFKFLPCVPARAPSRTCTLRHSPTHMHAFICLIFFFFFVLIFFFSPLVFFLFLLLWCAPSLLLSLFSTTSQRSFGPRSKVTPQLCSSCWRRGLTRRSNMR